MFGKLAKYMESSYLRSHIQIKLETRFQTFTYLVFAVDVVSTDLYTPTFLYFWGHPTFPNTMVFDTYIDPVYTRSMYARYLEVDATEAL